MFAICIPDICGDIVVIYSCSCIMGTLRPI